MCPQPRLSCSFGPHYVPVSPVARSSSSMPSSLSRSAEMLASTGCPAVSMTILASQGSYSRSHTCCHVGNSCPTMSAIRDSTLRRCSAWSEQTISISMQRLPARWATFRQAARVTSTGFTESATHGVAQSQVILSNRISDLVPLWPRYRYTGVAQRLLYGIDA